MNFESYEGRVVSVLIMGKDNQQENYVGVVCIVEDGFMVLDVSGIHSFLDEVNFRTELIQSIWVYRESDIKKMTKGRKVQVRDKYELGYGRKLK